MTSQLRQLLFYAGFGFISCIFVFWVPWGESEDQIAPNPSPELVSTVDDEQSSSTNQVPDLGKIVRVGIDAHLLTSGMIAFFSGFEEKNAVQIQLFELLENSFGSWESLDLILSEKVQETWLSLNFSQDISNFFLTGVQKYIQEKNHLPFGLDLLVGYHLKASDQTSDLTADPTYLPRLLNASDHDSIQANNLWIELLIKEMETINNRAGFEKLLEAMMPAELADKLITAYTKQEKCKNAPLPCLMQKWFISDGFSFQSMIKWNPDLDSDFFPSSLEKSYAKLISRSIPAQSSNLNWARALLLDYLQLDDAYLQELVSEHGLISPIWEHHPSNSLYQLRNLEILEPQPLFSHKQWLLLQKIIEKKLKPDLYFDPAFIY